ncbi:MAG: MFS transporter, partial [Alphaproteobacteria bacterium]
MTSLSEPAAGGSSLAPFRVRSFRFQWPADLATSWAFEMETIILGWYVLVETGSVFWLTVFGSLQYVGTLVSPMFGVLAGRVGYRMVMCGFRIVFTLQAATLMTLALTGLLEPLWVFIVATVMGIFRPSDLVMRYGVIGHTIPPAFLTGAMSICRTTTDSARVAGALAGAGTVAAFGMGTTYIAITALYVLCFLFSLGVARDRPGEPAQPASG